MHFIDTADYTYRFISRPELVLNSGMPSGNRLPVFLCAIVGCGKKSVLLIYMVKRKYGHFEEVFLF
jgi:hypothetical protein